MAPDTTAMELARGGLDRRGVVRAAALAGRPAGERVTVGGVVTHRQAPESAHGAVFLNLEDETGMVNIVCSVGRLDPVEAGGPHLPGAAGPGTGRAVRGVDDPGGRAVRATAPRPRPASRDFR